MRTFIIIGLTAILGSYVGCGEYQFQTASGDSTVSKLDGDGLDLVDPDTGEPIVDDNSDSTSDDTTTSDDDTLAEHDDATEDDSDEQVTETPAEDDTVEGTLEDTEEDIAANENSCSTSDAPNVRKVLVCHVPHGNTANRHDICIGAPAARAHLRHQDTLGHCE